jgi:hypothetical protein
MPTLSNLWNFRTIDRWVFVRRLPENGMFPLESEIVLNNVLTANALARDLFGKPPPANRW